MLPSHTHGDSVTGRTRGSRHLFRKAKSLSFKVMYTSCTKKKFEGFFPLFFGSLNILSSLCFFVIERALSPFCFFVGVETGNCALLSVNKGWGPVSKMLLLIMLY